MGSYILLVLDGLLWIQPIKLFSVSVFSGFLMLVAEIVWYGDCEEYVSATRLFFRSRQLLSIT